jgi:hypothetical protein
MFKENLQTQSMSLHLTNPALGFEWPSLKLLIKIFPTLLLTLLIIIIFLLMEY